MKNKIFLFGLLMMCSILYGQNQDCVDAIVICSDGPVSQTPLGPGSDDLSGNNSSTSCGTLENQSAWYIFAFNDDMPPNSVIEFTIVPLDGITDYDFAIWGPDVECNNLGPDIRCNFSFIGTTGLASPPPSAAFETPMVVQPGEVYIILIDNFSNSSIGFSMTWGGSAAPFLNCTPNCEVDVTLPEDITICHPPYEIDLSASVTDDQGTLSYQWTNLDYTDHIITNPFDLNTTIIAPEEYSTTGSFEFCVFDDVGSGVICEACDTINITTTVAPLIDFGDSGPFCLGDVVTMFPSPSDGFWSGDISSTGDIFTEDYGVGFFTAIYTVFVEDCEYEETFEYEILPNPIFEHNLMDTIFCDGRIILDFEIFNLQDVDNIFWSFPYDVIFVSGSESEAFVSVDWNNSFGDLVCVEVSNECTYSDIVCISVIWDEQVPSILSLVNNSVCITENDQIVSADVGPGVFSGTGIIDVDLGVFNPSNAGEGLHIISYELSNGCAVPVSISIEVVDTLELPVISCGDSGSDFVEFNWTHGSSTEFIISTYVNNVLRDDGISVSSNMYRVDNLLADQVVRIEVIAVGLGLCGNSSTVTLECSSDPCALLTIDIRDLPNICVSASMTEFNALPAGGVYSGTGIINQMNGEFTPNLIGVGDHSVYYTLTRPGGCVYIDSAMISIEPELPAPDVLCAGVSLDSVGFTWNTYPNVTDYTINTFINGIPDIVGLNLTTASLTLNGLNQNDSVSIEVYYNGINSCGNGPVGVQWCITQSCINTPPIIDPIGPLCETAGVVGLTATPSSGSFSGLGIGGSNATFDPVLAGVGNHVITYEYYDAIGCLQSETGEIVVEEILPPPIIDCNNTTSNSVTISWSHPYTSVSSYLISYSINTSGLTTQETTMSTSMTFSPLSEGDTVYLEVIAIGINSCGNSEPALQECIANNCPSNPFDLAGNQTEFCITDRPYQITGFPVDRVEITCDGHVLDVNGVFDPSVSGPGVFNILFYSSDGYNCTFEETLIFEVFDVVNPPLVNCVDQSINSVTFEWTGPMDAEYLITYFINNAIQGPISTFDNRITIDDLIEGSVVEMVVIIVNDTPCGDSDPGMATCTALDCDLTISDLPEELVICDASAVSIEPNITGSGSQYSYEWMTPTGTFMTKDIMALETGDYVLVVRDDRGCMAVGSFSRRENPIIPLITINDPSCFGVDDGLIRIEEISGGTPDYSVSLNGGAFSSIKEYTSLSPDNYEVVIQDIEGCSWAGNFNLRQPDEFLFSIDSTVVVAYGDSLIIDVEVSERTDSLVTFKVWRSADPNIVCPDCWTLISLPTFTANYVLNVETANGCTGDGMLRSIIEHDRTVYIPNVFRPNSSDRRNQIFQIFTSEEVAMVEDFQVYNRWGDRMYNIDVPYDPRTEEVGWDGIYRGSLASTGVYVFWIKVRFTDGTEGYFNGDVTLLR